MRAITRKVIGKRRQKTIMPTVRVEARERRPLQKSRAQEKTGVNKTASTVENMSVWINGSTMEKPRYKENSNNSIRNTL